MVKRSSYNARLNRGYQAIARFTKQAEKLMSDIEKKQSLINKDVAKIKALKKRRSLSDSDFVKISKMQFNIKNRGKYIHKKRELLRKTEIQLDKSILDIKKPHYAPISKKDKNGYFIRYRQHPPQIITDETIDDLVELVRDKLELTSHMLSDKRYKHNMNIDDNTIKYIRLIFSDLHSDFQSSVNCNSLDEVREKLIVEMNKHNAGGENRTKQIGKYQQAQLDANEPLRLRGGAGLPPGINSNHIRRAQAIAYDGDEGDWYDRFLQAIDFFFYNGVGQVGCSSRLKPKFAFHLSQNELIYLYCPRSTQNRCFDTCLIKGIDLYSKIRSFDIRHKLGIKTNCKLDPKSKSSHKIADELNVGYIVFNGIRKNDRLSCDSIENSFPVYCSYGLKKYDKIILIIKIAGHCYLINDEHIYKKQCDKCGAVRKNGLPKDHKCKPKEMSYYQKQICNNEVINNTNLRIEKQRNWVVFDLETLPCGPGDTHMVYAVGWFDYQNKRYYHSYGRNAMSEFMQWTRQHGKGKTYMAYNGSRFDFYFLQKEIIKSGKTPSFLTNGGRILSLQWDGTKVKKGHSITIQNRSNVWDLCNFLVGFSLKKACQAFDTKFQKQDFDHARMHDWSCVDNPINKKDCLHYLYYDVMSLVELTAKYVDSCEDEFKASPTKYLTLSSFAESVWKSNLTDVVCIPDMEQQEFIRRSVYGGRTYPCRKRFQSKLYKAIMSNKSNVRKLKNIYSLLLKSGDYIFNGDINSQYPACMAGSELMPTLFPTGFCKWINDPIQAEQIFNANKQLGIYEIEFTCPNKRLRHAILPRKKLIQRKNGKKLFSGIEWSLTDGRGTYNTVDIQNAVKHGYKIKFVGRALIWEGVSDNVFKSYIHNVYAKKVEATSSGNNVKRQIAKLMMNSLYGKTLQNPIKTHECIAKTAEEIETFLSQHVLTDWQLIEKNDEMDYVILTGEKVNEKRISKKAIQLGSFVLGYSRRLWLQFLETIDPTIESEITTYLDTDSLHISGKHYDKLKKAKMIDNDKLGFLSNDCKDNALIIKEINLSPKCYFYEALTEDGEIFTTMKSKGIMRSKTVEKEYREVITNDNGDVVETKQWKSIEIPILKPEWFELDKPQQANWTGFKKINKRVSKSDRLAGVEHFTIKKQQYNRTFNKSAWEGMNEVDGYFFPFGYDN